MAMIAQKNWFKRRKYGGWGVSPKTWQGWLYIAAIILPLLIFQSLPFWGVQTRLIVTFAWVLFLFIDLIPVMIALNRDEREYKIEAISERNAAWVMVLVLIIGILYRLITSALAQSIQIDWWLVAALFGGLIAKSISNMVLEKKAL